jgi:tetratricopeptide (TPR) repeat protein
MDVREIGRLLNASLMLEGSVCRRDGRVRVSAQLTEAAAGVQLWSGTLERELCDAWAVQQDVAKAVASAVHLELGAGGGRHVGRRHTQHADAFELYLRGRHLLDRFEAVAQRDALELFRQACDADPAYPLPLLGIARARMNLALLGEAPPKDVVPAAKAALRRALDLDPDLAEAHSLMASVISHHEWNWAEAETHYRLALRLAPHTAEVHDEYATGYLAPLGRIEEALAESRVARGLDPFSPQLDRSFVFILLLARRLPDAERECRRVLEKRPDDGYVRLVLALALHGQRRVPEALVEYERVYAGDPSLQHEAYVADVRALRGDRGPAEALLARLNERRRHEFVPAMIFAWLYLHLGRIDEAVTAIEEAWCNQEYELLLTRMGYGFDSFRQHPRFRAVLGKLGLA